MKWRKNAQNFILILDLWKEKSKRENLTRGGRYLKYRPPLCPCNSVHSKPNWEPKILRKFMEAEGSMENHRTRFLSEARSHSRGTKLQNHGVLSFYFSLSLFAVPFSEPGRCRCTVPRSVYSPRRRHRARLHTQNLALHGLEVTSHEADVWLARHCWNWSTIIYTIFIS